MVSSPEIARKKYVEKITAAIQSNKQCENVAKYLGVDPATVCASAPAEQWKKVMKNADKIFDILLADYKAAWTGGKY